MTASKSVRPDIIADAKSASVLIYLRDFSGGNNRHSSEATQEQSIRMREGQDTSIFVVWVANGLEPKVGELDRNFSSSFRRFGFDNESVRAPAHNGDVASTAEFAGGIEPRRILGPGEERHRGSIRSPEIEGLRTYDVLYLRNKWALAARCLVS